MTHREALGRVVRFRVRIVVIVTRILCPEAVPARSERRARRVHVRRVGGRDPVGRVRPTDDRDVGPGGRPAGRAALVVVAASGRTGRNRRCRSDLSGGGARTRDRRDVVNGVPGVTVPAAEPSAFDACVSTPASQSPNGPMVKSFSTDVGDVDVRVSAKVDAKHSPPRPRSVRLMPPSKNSPGRKVVLPLLSVNGQGAVFGASCALLTMAQASSPAGSDAEPQSALVDVVTTRRFAAAQSPAWGLLLSAFVHPGRSGWAHLGRPTCTR